MTTFAVYGIPAPQGSKRAMPQSKIGANGKRYFTGKVNLIESSAKVKPWRAAVHEEARKHFPAPIPGAVAVDLWFYLPRPKEHYRTGRFAHLLKPSAPAFPAVKPDGDKLIRSTLDALTTAGAYRDDAAVVDYTAKKRYADGCQPGAVIRVRPIIIVKEPSNAP